MRDERHLTLPNPVRGKNTNAAPGPVVAAVTAVTPADAAAEAFAGSLTKDQASTFDLFPRPVGGAKPNALPRILARHVPVTARSPAVSQFSTPFAGGRQVRSIGRPWQAQAATAFLFSFPVSLP